MLETMNDYFSLIFLLFACFFVIRKLLGFIVVENDRGISKRYKAMANYSQNEEE